MFAGVDGLRRDETRPSRIPPLSPEVAERVGALTLGDPPGESPLDGSGDGGTGRHQGQLAAAHLAGRWLQPHRMRQFKLATAPQFVVKIRDLVGLSLDPPAQAVVRALIWAGLAVCVIGATLYDLGLLHW